MPVLTLAEEVAALTQNSAEGQLAQAESIARMDGIHAQSVADSAARDAEVVAMGAQVDGYIAGARAEYPYRLISENQELAGVGVVPDLWAGIVGTTFTKVQDVVDGTAWAARSQEEQDLLTAMGLPGVQYIYKPFAIWQMDWVDNANEATLYQRISATTKISVAAYTRLISGGIQYAWAEGAGAAWSLTGMRFAAGPLAYQNIHPLKTSPAGSMMFALPGAVSGHVPLEDGVWGMYSK